MPGMSPCTEKKKKVKHKKFTQVIWQDQITDSVLPSYMSMNEIIYLWCSHRFRQEIEESAPFLSQHGAPIGGIQVFPVSK